LAVAVTPDRRILRLFSLIWLVHTVHWAPYIVREHFPAITLAEQGTLDVSRFLGWSEDVFRGPRGGAFINNNPGASVLGAVPLALARPLLAAIGRWNATLPPPVVREPPEGEVYRRAVAERREWYFLAIAFLTVAGLMAPLSALTGALLARTLHASGLSRATAVGIAIVYAVGTPVFFRAEYLNHNLIVGHVGLLAFLLVWDPARRPPTPLRAAGAGLLAGVAALCDFTGFLVLGVLGLYVWTRAGDGAATGRTRLTASFAAAAVPSLLALLAYQQIAFGNPALPSQHYMPPTAPTAHGYRGIDWPSLELIWMNFFDPRFGLFVSCPLLALGLAAPVVRSVPVRMPRREMLFGLGLVWLFVAFCSANQYSRLQYTTGVRYLVPIVPVLLLLALQVIQAFPPRVRGWLLALTIAHGWWLAISRQPLPLVADDLRRGLQLTWVRRMYELGLLEHPTLVSWTLILACIACVGLVWREEVACGS
jgi:hypothetical protein